MPWILIYDQQSGKSGWLGPACWTGETYARIDESTASESLVIGVEKRKTEPRKHSAEYERLLIAERGSVRPVYDAEHTLTQLRDLSEKTSVSVSRLTGQFIDVLKLTGGARSTGTALRIFRRTAAAVVRDRTTWGFEFERRYKFLENALPHTNWFISGPHVDSRKARLSNLVHLSQVLETYRKTGVPIGDLVETFKRLSQVHEYGLLFPKALFKQLTEVSHDPQSWAKSLDRFDQLSSVADPLTAYTAVAVFYKKSGGLDAAQQDLAFARTLSRVGARGTLNAAVLISDRDSRQLWRTYEKTGVPVDELIKTFKEFSALSERVGYDGDRFATRVFRKLTAVSDDPRSWDKSLGRFAQLSSRLKPQPALVALHNFYRDAKELTGDARDSVFERTLSIAQARTTLLWAEAQGLGASSNRTEADAEADLKLLLTLHRRFPQRSLEDFTLDFLQVFALAGGRTSTTQAALTALGGAIAANDQLDWDAAIMRFGKLVRQYGFDSVQKTLEMHVRHGDSLDDPGLLNDLEADQAALVLARDVTELAQALTLISLARKQVGISTSAATAALKGLLLLHLPGGEQGALDVFHLLGRVATNSAEWDFYFDQAHRRLVGRRPDRLKETLEWLRSEVKTKRAAADDEPRKG